VSGLYESYHERVRRLKQEHAAETIAYRKEIERLRIDNGELRLVLESQDRRLKQLMDVISRLRALLGEES